MVRLLAERYDTKSNVKLGRFWSHLQTSNVFSHTEELWYNETVCLWMTTYIWFVNKYLVHKILNKSELINEMVSNTSNINKSIKYLFAHS